MKRIIVPTEVADCDVIASVSGGKDSSALALSLREADVPFRMVFADTGWEAPETYAHLDTLRRLIGPIDVVKPKRDMRDSIKHRAGFPARMQRWCTQELKIMPLRAYHDEHEDRTGRETVCAMGVRAEESASRSKMAVFDDEPARDSEGERGWGGYVWRPILDWTVADVIEIHRRHGVPMNPLYHAGFDRVGCYPCIFSRKEEIRLLAMRSPERIDEIDGMERAVTDDRALRNAEHRAAGNDEDRYKHPQGTFFQGRAGVGASDGYVKIRDVVSWAMTDKGGRQFPILQDPPRGGCMRWGLCEAPPTEDADIERVLKVKP